ncbi:NAD(P)/FAD-dependent oxidoreductase [Pseudodesulfovibrio senegalensis]|jgi:thioredoxin reductase (NADPH)|uniref:Thioredoxin reductase n=1 Tax=Pseudodesulfovibrio senegalensis TaxID=1721087 RepID=A0A6N6N6D5_9BACT|nr:FAD-dependent oxidoreductase [Pseudodesulfovibrio senegalensis]KAB1443634.1 thioredoxin reductase [Pseudodesulfovibrio senegalensis]
MQNPTPYDVVILGSGPAGIQAAIHSARKKARTLMLGRVTNSSLYWAHVENYCCMFKISGEEILRTGREQAAGFGAEFMEQDVLSISKQDGLFSIVPENDEVITTKSIIIAMGTTRNKLGVPGEKRLLGKGVSYCVDCDAGFYRNDIVAVAGCGSAAAGGALALTQYASAVHLVCDKLDIADALKQRLKESSVTIHEGRSITEIKGENAVQSINMDDGSNIDVAGVFIELGAKGVLELASELGIALDDNMRYVTVDRKMQTNVEGIYAAGDITGPPLQMAKAVGEGCVAGVEAAVFAKRLKRD